MSLCQAVVFPNDRKIDARSNTIWCWSFLYSVLHKYLVMCFSKLLELVEQEEKALCFLKCPLTFLGKPLQNKPLVPPLSPPPVVHYLHSQEQPGEEFSLLLAYTVACSFYFPYRELKIFLQSLFELTLKISNMSVTRILTLNEIKLYLLQLQRLTWS